MFLVSNFDTPYFLLKSLCSSVGCSFVDLPIEFKYLGEDNKTVGLCDGKLLVGNHSNIATNMWAIIFTYIHNFHDITGRKIFYNKKQEMNVLFKINHYLGKLFLPLRGTLDDFELDNAIIQRVYQYPFLWVAFKDIVCPAFSIQNKNLPILLGSNDHLNEVQLIEESMLESDEEDLSCDFPAVYVSSQLRSKPFKLARMFIELLKAHDLNPTEVVDKISHSELNSKLHGLAKLSFPDPVDLREFEMTLLTYANIDNYIEEIVDQNKEFHKQAQANSMGDMSSHSTWWYLGLIEKMLEPARGDDWSTFQTLDSYRDELQKEIEKTRKEHNLDGLTMDALLRVQSGENTPNDIKLLEKDLSSDRVW